MNRKQPTKKITPNPDKSAVELKLATKNLARILRDKEQQKRCPRKKKEPTDT